MTYIPTLDSWVTPQICDTVILRNVIPVVRVEHVESSQ